MAGLSAPANPYLVGYEDYLRRPNVERNRTEPLHPATSASVSNSRAAAAVSRTYAPSTSAEPLQSSMRYQQAIKNLETGGAIDSLVPPSPVRPPSHQGALDGMNAAGTTSRPQTPTTLNIVARPPAVTAGPMEPAAVEITISTQPEQPYAQPFVSHLQGLTVQQMLDLDVDTLVVKLDEHHAQAKKAVLDHFMDTKARLMQAKNDALDDEKSKCASRLAAKEEELNLLKAEVDTVRIKSQRLWDLVGRACTAYGNAKEHRRINLVQFQVFCAWRHQATELARRRRMLARAERWDTQVRLKRNIFCAWFREAMRAHRVTVNNRYIQEVENAKRMIHENYQQQISNLERTLADAHVQLERAAEARSRLEEDMKRAFMRGVCALNIEAMNMMKRGQAPGGNGSAAAGAPPPAEQPPAESGPGAGPASSAPAQPTQTSLGQALPETLNLDLHGSITFSQPGLVAPTGGAAGSARGGSGGPVTSTPGQPPIAASNAAVRLTGSGASTVQAMSTGLAAGSSRTSSGYGLGAPGVAAGGGSNPGIGRPSAGSQQAAGPGGASTSGGGADGGPPVRETAQTFYQRPQIVVTRGPGIGLAATSADAPRPRTNAPLPTVRML